MGVLKLMWGDACWWLRNTRDNLIGRVIAWYLAAVERAEDRFD